MKTNHLTDEQLVDWIEGEIKDDTFIWTHLNQCEHCYQSYREWKRLLQSDETMNEVDRKKVWRNIQSQKQQKDFQKTKRKKYYLTAAWAASCLLFLIVGFFAGQGQSNASSPQTTQGTELSQFMNDPVEHYDMVNSEDGKRQGIAWYDPLNRQMILYLDDPKALGNNLREVQIETEERVFQVMPNHLQNGKMQLYLSDDRLNDLLQLIVTNPENGEQKYYFKVVSE